MSAKLSNKSGSRHVPECRETRHSDDDDHFGASSFSNLLKQVSIDPLKGLKRCASAWKANDDDHRKRQYDLFAVLCAYTAKCIEDPEERSKLLDVWRDKPREPDDRQPAILAARLMLGATGVADGNLYEQARVYAKAVSHFLEAGVEAKVIPDALREAGGIHKVAKRTAKPKRVTDVDEKVVAPKKEEEQAEDEPESDGGCASSKKQASSALVQESGSRKKPAALSKPKPRFDPEHHLAISAGAHFDTVLSLDEGQAVWLKIRRTKNVLEWKEFEIVETDPE